MIPKFQRAEESPGELVQNEDSQAHPRGGLSLPPNGETRASAAKIYILYFLNQKITSNS